jgi:threonine/homoserine/homoserine lactone efflux protein
MPIGAVGSYLVGLAARERTAIAVAAALGIASVDGAYAILAAVGGTGLQRMLNQVSGWLTYAAAITLVVVAVHTIRTALRRYRGHTQTRAQLGRLTPARAYLSLAGLTAINPATVVTFAAVIVGRTASHGGSSWPAVALFALGASWHLPPGSCCSPEAAVCSADCFAPAEGSSEYPSAQLSSCLAWLSVCC